MTLFCCLLLAVPSLVANYRQAYDDSDCSTPKNIMFVRHGESINNIVSQSAKQAALQGELVLAGRAWRRYQESIEYLKKKGWSTVRDSPLSKKGWSDMKAVGDLLFKDGNKSSDKFDVFSSFKKVFVSPLRRTQSTAFRIFGRAAKDAKVPFEAQPWAHEQRKSQSDTGEKASVLMEFAREIGKQHGIKPSVEPLKTFVQSLNELGENWATDETQPTKYLPYYPPDEFEADSYFGETTRETDENLAKRLEQLKDELCRDPTPNIILVTHSSVIRHLLPELFVKKRPANGGMFVAVLQRKAGQLVLSSPMTASNYFQETLKLPSKPELPDFLKRRRKRRRRKREQASNASNALDRKQLRVTILSASGLRDRDWIGESDSYCTVAVEGDRGVKGQTKVIANELNPVWNEKVDINDYISGASLVFQVWDRDRMKFDDALGDVTLSSDKFYPHGTGKHPLELTLNNTGTGASGSLKVKISVLQNVEQGAPELITTDELNKQGIAYVKDVPKENLERDAHAHAKK